MSQINFIKIGIIHKISAFVKLLKLSEFQNLFSRIIRDFYFKNKNYFFFSQDIKSKA